MSIPATNVYRCLKMCADCPFADNGKAMKLHEGRVADIKQMLLSDDGSSFNCHKTVYDLKAGDPDYKKMCAGAYEFLQQNGRANVQMHLAYAMGIDKPNKKEMR